ncbi:MULTISPECIES: RcnB family protein [unclassified Variovorax]|uniref:RcnB family protein n=1 Tax=unclassified Variovorax TaxID=663243 RepID=UPI002577F0E8|nr:MULTISPECIES: RcnB family protein [unclassified Variovorax]MDM0090791.1 RcnB family protein [Variovorax sp. J22G40]MDM0149207.1 RcnB family protein [Variovorax sp. J2P1-31]
MNNNRSKRVTTLVAGVLALCMAGSAFAQDRRGDDRDYRGPPRPGQLYIKSPHEQRQDQRYNQQRYDRQDYRDGRFADRRGYPQPHVEWRRGGRVPPEYRGRNYVVDDWRGHRLQQPPRGYQWVGVGGDFVLAAIATGVIAQIIAAQ